MLISGIIYYLDNVVILPAVTADITRRTKFYNITETILSQSLSEIRSFSNSSHSLFVVVAAARICTLAIWARRTNNYVFAFL